MEYVYILSDPDSIKNSKYKIGITKRNQEYLLRDYRRSRPEVKLFLFEPCTNNKLIETEILEKFQDKRINHESGKPSEWLKIDVKLLIKEVKKLLINNNQNNQNNNNQNNNNNNNNNVYSIGNFIRDCCTLNKDNSESCQDLYNKYIQTNALNIHMSKNIFYKSIVEYIAEYYRITKKDVKIKKNGITYYKGIKINNVYNYSCIIL